MQVVFRLPASALLLARGSPISLLVPSYPAEARRPFEHACACDVSLERLSWRVRRLVDLPSTYRRVSNVCRSYPPDRKVSKFLLVLRENVAQNQSSSVIAAHAVNTTARGGRCGTEVHTV